MCLLCCEQQLSMAFGDYEEDFIASRQFSDWGRVVADFRADRDDLVTRVMEAGDLEVLRRIHAELGYAFALEHVQRVVVSELLPSSRTLELIRFIVDNSPPPVDAFAAVGPSIDHLVFLAMQTDGDAIRARKHVLAVLDYLLSLSSVARVREWKKRTMAAVKSQVEYLANHGRRVPRISRLSRILGAE